MLESRSVGTETNPRRAIAAVLLLLVTLSWVPLGRAASLRASRSSLRSPIISLSTLAVLADFDGDHAIDGVKLHSNGFHKIIDIKFANLRTTEFSFATTSLDQGALIPKDIDGDGDVDLVWVAGRDKNTAVVLINDGKGDFTRTNDNAAYASELNALLDSTDPSDQYSLQAGHQNLSLTSPSFPDISLPVAHRIAGPTSYAVLFFSFNGFTDRSAFLSYLHKRGPPTILS